MKLTFQIPDIIIDNTKSEALVELITKASQSLDQSGSILLSDGDKHFVVTNISDLTSSLIHAINANYPLTVDNTNPIRPVIKIGSIIPVASGGTGLSSLTSGTLLVANSTSSFATLSGSNSQNGYSVVWVTGSGFSLAKGGIDVEPTGEGQLLISSGSKYVSKNLTAGNNIGITNGSGSVTVSLSSSLSGLTAVTASYFSGSGKNITNITASNIDGLSGYIYNSITGSGSITVSNTGTASLNSDVSVSKLTASTHVSAALFYGDGSNLTKISASYLNTLSQSVYVSGSLSASSDITGSNFSGSYFYGDGSYLKNITVEASGSITGSGASDNKIRLTDIVKIGTLSASYAEVSGGLSVGDYVQLLPVGAVNIPTNTTASYIYTSGSTNDMYFTQYQGDFTNTTRLRWLESTLNTGLLHGGVITTENGTNKFSVTAGSGLIVEFNASTGSDPCPTINFVTWPAVVSASLDFSSSYPITYISIKPTDANKSIGEVRQTTNAPTFSEFKDYIVLGRVLHQSGAVTNGAVTTPATAYAVNSNVADFVRAIGPLKISGHILSPSGSGPASTLALTKTTGDSYVEGRNYSTNPNIPNIIPSGSDLPVTTTKIYYQHISGSKAIIDNGIAGAGYAVLTASLYQNTDGNLAAVGNSEFSVQRVFWFPNAVNNALFVYYGQAKYANYEDAVAGISTETFVESDNTRSSAILVAYIVLRGNAPNFEDPKVAKIFQAGLFRGGAGGGGGGVGAGATNLASLTDVDVGSQTDGQALVYNGSKWANGTPHNAYTASILQGFDKNDYLTTASFNTFTGSYMTGSFSGSLYGTASWASSSLTSSYLSSSAQGNIINTSSSLPALRIIQRGSGSVIFIEDDEANPDSTPFVIDNAGKVGIGTATPQSNLDLSFNGATAKIGSTNFTNVVTAPAMSISANSLSRYVGLSLLNTVSASGSENRIVTNDSSTYLKFGVNNTAFIGAASVLGSSSDSYIGVSGASGSNLWVSNNTSGNSKGNIYFTVGSTIQSASTTPALFISSSGFVGIGTSSPTRALNVVGDILISGTLKSDRSGNKLRFYDDQSMIYRSGSDPAGTLVLSVSASDRLTILGTNGNVGIGVEAPQAKLEVSGNVKATSFTGSFSGSGASITDLTASQIGGLQQYIYNSVTGSGSITVSSGTASLNTAVSVLTLTASTHVSAANFYGNGSNLSGVQATVNTSGNISGNGSSGSPIKLNNSINLTGDLTASFVTSSQVSASQITASYFKGNGVSIINIDATNNISGTLPTNHGGTGLSSFTSGALYIASSTSTLSPFTGSDFQLIAWNSATGRWQSYSQPYDIAVDIYGGTVANAVILKYKTPRSINITDISPSVGLPSTNFNLFIDDTVYATPVTASAGQTIKLTRTSEGADYSVTLVANLI